MGVQCFSWSQGRHNLTMSLPNQIYGMASTSSSTVNLGTQLATKRNGNIEEKWANEVSWERPSKPNIGQFKALEARWRQFFADPSQWWDHRLGKTSVKFPDFKHKETHQGLWVNDRLNPEWVEAQLETIAPGTLKHSLSYWSKEIEKRVKGKNDKIAFELFEQMERDGVQADKFTLNAMLKACARSRALEKGRAIHEQIVQNGYELDAFLGKSLFDMYAKCGRIEEAQEVFQSLPRRDVVMWTSMIVTCARNGRGREGLALYREMESAKVTPIPKTYVAALNACANIGALEDGKRIHAQITQSGCGSDIFVGNSLIDMYTKSGSIEEAERVFDKMPTRNVTAWNAMIGAYVRGGQAQKAFELYKQMQAESMGFIPATFILALKACANLGDLDEGRHVHAHIAKIGCESNVFIARSLVDMYSKCGSLEDAERVFGTMPDWNSMSWTAMIGGYVKCGQGQKALELYRQMQDRNLAPIPSTFVGVLNACASVAALEQGRQVHAQIIERGCESDMFVRTSLIDMYSKCGSITEARAVFNKMRTRNVVAWSAMILAHVKCGEGRKALKLYQQMLRIGLKPFPTTFLAVLNACASVGALEDGRRIHEQIIQSGCESDLFVGSCLIDMYAKCGSIEDAQRLFTKMDTLSVVCWNTMISGYVRCGQAQKALELFEQMQAKGVEPVSATFVGVLGACGSSKALEDGRRIHEQIIQSGCESDLFVGSCLIDMYAKCGSTEDARAVFDSLNTKNVFCWNTMLLGYVKRGQGDKALELYKQMEPEGVERNHVSYVAGLTASVSAGALEEGRQVHSQVIQRGFESDAQVAGSLVEMYLKLGSLEDAASVFEKLPKPSVGSWNTMIWGYVNSKDGRKALEVFAQMQAGKVEPSSATFVALLSACTLLGALGAGRRIHSQVIDAGYECDVVVGHALLNMYCKCGSIEDAQKLFNRMESPHLRCWNTMLEGHSMHSQAQEAIQLFETMSLESGEVDEDTFLSLLSACRHGGLVDEGFHYFKSMASVYGLTPRKEHHACIADLLGRSGYLREAENMINRMPCEPDVAVWLALLEACRIHADFEMGERIAERVLAVGPENASGYDVLANFFVAAGKWDSREHVNQLRMERVVAEENLVCTFIEVDDKVHSFTGDEQGHPQIEQLHAKLRGLSESMKEAGYGPECCSVLHDKEDEETVSPLSHHSEMLAIAYGLITTTTGTPIRIVKNIKVCEDCHNANKMISRVSGRTIIARYGSRFHQFKNGHCSCRDGW